MRLLSALLLVAGLGLADTVTFRDGHTVNGSFLGGDARSIRVAVGDRVENYPIGDITEISFRAPVSAASRARRTARVEVKPGVKSRAKTAARNTAALRLPRAPC